ncbi:MAG: hypothetical protein OXD36_05020 [Rhodobacter sp.]|nr:hypothetical protein [Rhodobacter sp.]MCY4241084.1 hypothetical protein [Rhodobacter sp.]
MADAKRAAIDDGRCLNVIVSENLSAFQDMPRLFSSPSFSQIEILGHQSRFPSSGMSTAIFASLGLVDNHDATTPLATG